MTADLYLRRLEVLDRDRVRVHFTALVAGQKRLVVVTLIGRRVVDLQASDETRSWIGGTGSDRLTAIAKARALEEVARIRAYRFLARGTGSRSSWTRRPAWNH